MSVRRFAPWLIPCVCSLVIGLARPLAAQDPALTEALAGVLQAEDQRRFDEPLLSTAARHPDPIVRRHAALAMGRIGDAAAVPYLIELLSDPDTSVAADAAFALGLIGSADAVAPLREIVLRAQPIIDGPGAPVEDEAARSLARRVFVYNATSSRQSLARSMSIVTNPTRATAVASADRRLPVVVRPMPARIHVSAAATVIPNAGRYR